MIARQTQLKKRLIVSSKVGLHARPAAKLVQVAQKFGAEIEISLKGKKANAKSMMGVLTLCAEFGARVTVSARGDDAKEAMEAISSLFASNFQELPDPAAGGTMTKAGSSVELPQGKGETVLIADDEASIRQMLKIILDGNGYQTVVARNGLEAIALFLAQPNVIRAMVLDMVMPEMNGVEAMRAIRRMSPSLPVLAMSGSIETFPFPDDSAAVFLRKPFGGTDLLYTLRALMDGGGVEELIP